MGAIYKLKNGSRVYVSFDHKLVIDIDDIFGPERNAYAEAIDFVLDGGGKTLERTTLGEMEREDRERRAR